jgi:hypothetical protein
VDKEVVLRADLVKVVTVGANTTTEVEPKLSLSDIITSGIPCSF